MVRVADNEVAIMKTSTINHSRRAFLKWGSVPVLALSTKSLLGQTSPEEPSGRPPPRDPELIRSFVGVCHGDLETVASMLKREPGLVNASANRFGDDWERGMEAAAHMGRRDIADTLIDYRARRCIFWAAMSGEEGVVRAFVAADPESVHTGGAHNISLMAHVANSGQVPLAQFIRQEGAAVDRKSLEHAVRGNHIEMVEWLVEEGVDPASRDFRNRLLYELAESQGKDRIARFLKSKAGI